MTCRKPIKMKVKKTKFSMTKLKKNQWKSKPKSLSRIAKNVKNAKKAKKIV